jgi:hypothetical protein
METSFTGKLKPRRSYVFLALFVLLFLFNDTAYAAPDIWTAATTTNNGGNRMFGVSMSDANNGVAVGESGTMVFTTNGGVDWTAATTTNNGGNRMFGVSMSDANNGVAVGLVGTMVFISSPLVASSSSSSGGSDNAHKTKPTFGIDHNTSVQQIEGGFGFNDESFDITDNYWTPFAEQEVRIGEMNTFTSKVFADKQLKVIEFLFGIPEVGEAHLAELGVEVHYDHQGEIIDFKAVQKSNIIDIDSVKVENYPSKCVKEDKYKICTTTAISMIFNEPLQDKVMALKAIDQKNRYQITYLNEGFDISGESLNPMITLMIAGIEKNEKPILLTQIEKYSDIWLSADGRFFEMFDMSDSFKLIVQPEIVLTKTSLNTKQIQLDYGEFKIHQIGTSKFWITDDGRIFINQGISASTDKERFTMMHAPDGEKSADTGVIKSKSHSAFANWKQEQATIATSYWDSSKIQGSLDDSFKYVPSEIDTRTQFLIDNNMLDWAKQ